MNSNINNSSNGRILFIGNENRILDDLIKHIPASYEMIKCSRDEADIKNNIRNLEPHVLVICLADESWETLRVFHALENNKKYINIPVIIMGKEDDCTLFKKMIAIEYLEVFIRPLDRADFINSLEKYIAFSEEENPEELEENEVSLSASEEDMVSKINQMSKINGMQNILVVDDDVRMLNVIKLYLQDLYNVTVVPSGKLALKFLSKKSADLVLLDYMMPEMDGTEVLKEIRENSPNPKVPVLFLTGVADKDLVMKGLEYRPNGYLLKPATREILLERVTEILLGL